MKSDNLILTQDMAEDFMSGCTVKIRSHMAEKSAEVTHNHPEGIKGAVVTAVCIWMARHGKTKEDIFQSKSRRHSC